MAQRLVRAKRKIAKAAHPLPRPARRRAARPPRRRAGRRLPRVQRGLRRAARRPARARASSATRPSASAGCSPRSCPTTPRPPACSRSCSCRTRAASARTDADGRYVPLPDQDRVALGRRAHRGGHARRSTARCACAGPGPYQLQAAIAALHADGADGRRHRLAADRGALRPADAPHAARRSCRSTARSRSAWRTAPRAGLGVLEPLQRRPAPRRLPAVPRRPGRPAPPRAATARPPRAAYDRAIAASARTPSSAPSSSAAGPRWPPADVSRARRARSRQSQIR